jgi:DNA-binding CsgD family transcriptional regulator/PAS domain-containing protein
MSATPNGVRQGTAARSAAQALARAPVVRLGVRSPPTGPELHEQMAQLLHEGALEPKRWREFLEVLGRQLKGNSATLILRSPTIGETGLLYTWGGSAEVISQYARRYFATDPFVQLPDKQVITLHDFVPPGELERSPFFTDYLVPWDSIYHLGVDVRDEGRFYARLRVSRPRSAGNFSAADRAVVERLVPHFDNAIRTRATIDAARMGRAVYAEAMDQLTLATLILDTTGRVIHANALARDLLGQPDRITLAGDRLVFTEPTDAKRFRDAVERAIDARRAVQPGIVEALRVRRALGPGQFAVIVRPASGRLGTEEPTLSSAVAVFISAETDRAQTPPVETVRKLFDLTRKEAQLAMCLTNGRSLREAAADLDITLNTARAHLRSIFAKTGIDRQARLVRAILRSVAALG